MSKADRNANKEIDFAEFVKYMTDHERNLKLAFGNLDRNKDGKYREVQYIILDLNSKIGMRIV